jgi:hypothetical protein
VRMMHVGTALVEDSTKDDGGACCVPSNLDAQMNCVAVCAAACAEGAPELEPCELRLAGHGYAVSRRRVPE